MAIETRHREMDILFKLLMLPKAIRTTNEVADLISNLIASMEADDVEIVKKQVMEREAMKREAAAAE
jgi:hypothetical protein